MSYMPNTYFFVDGSALIADVRSVMKKNRKLAGKKLCLKELMRHFTGVKYHHLTGQGYRRFVFYFVANDIRLKECFILPDYASPDEIVDLEIKYCGKRLRGSKSVERWIEDNPPPKAVLDRMHRSEKAVDTQICCDALQYASYGKMDRLFLYANDYDYLPLCNVLKFLGSNISLFRLFKERVNKELVAHCDSFSVVGVEHYDQMFV